MGGLGLVLELDNHPDVPQYGISGPYWYAGGATIQIIIFSILSIMLKMRAPGAKTFLQVSSLFLSSSHPYLEGLLFVKYKFLCAGDQGQVRFPHPPCVLHLRVPDKPDSDDEPHHRRHSRPQQVRHVLMLLSYIRFPV